MSRLNLKEAIQIGLIGGAIALGLCMIGLIEAFNERDVITDLISLGRVLFFSAAPVVGYVVCQRQGLKSAPAVLTGGLLAGAVAALPIFGLNVLNLLWPNMRQAFINVSPTLIEIISLGQANAFAAGLYLIVIYGVLGLLGAALTLLPAQLRDALVTGLGWTIGAGVMSEILINILRPRMGAAAMNALFGSSGLRLTPAISLFVLIFIGRWLWQSWGRSAYQSYRSGLSHRQTIGWQRFGLLLTILLLLILPSILGIYLSEIMNNVGLYILMGLGLNIAVGLAGLLDLGYVTNFAVGAYVMAVLTSTGPLGVAQKGGVDMFTFWMVLPISVLAAMITGFILALPVLRMRGDYLAITTLGFGEIIRILARSDWLAPLIGGAQGILQIPKAALTGWFAWAVSWIQLPFVWLFYRFGINLLEVDGNGQIVFGTPPQLYYLLVLACLLMLFVSRRLNNSRTGRQWMAMREDEDVAAAMGIDTTRVKIIAFTLSAASGGLAGAIFAAKLGSIYPHSFQLLISINVLALIIVGGMGSIPGIVVGAFALVGLPELLREFAEFRLLFYGIALMVMMLVRPEGLWPSAVTQRIAFEQVAPVTAGD
ncbi:MAG: hypothetical protein R3A44_37820 [Caldilineaceae bacterium]